MNSERITLGRLPVDRVTRGEVIARIDTLIRSRRGGYVVTPNVDHIVMGQHDPRFCEAYRDSSLSIADGQPLLWMAKALGTPLPAKLSGSDLIEPLMAYAAAHRRRVFFFGTTPDVCAEAKRRLQARYPGLMVVGQDSSVWSPEAAEPAGGSAVVQAIRRAGGDIVIVNLGSPKQELWMQRHRRELAPAVLFGLGGTLNFVAGTVKRSPAWVSQAGIEWLFRLSQEPGRLAHRYLVRDMQIVPIFGAALWRRLVNRDRTRYWDTARPAPAVSSLDLSARRLAPVVARSGRRMHEASGK